MRILERERLLALMFTAHPKYMEYTLPADIRWTPGSTRIALIFGRWG